MSFHGSEDFARQMSERRLAEQKNRFESRDPIEIAGRTYFIERSDGRTGLCAGKFTNPFLVVEGKISDDTISVAIKAYEAGREDGIYLGKEERSGELRALLGISS